MEKAKAFFKHAGMPASWLMISLVLGMFGAPPQVIAFLHAVVSVAPDAINLAATVTAAGVTAYTAVKAAKAADVPEGGPDA